MAGGGYYRESLGAVQSRNVDTPRTFQIQFTFVLWTGKEMLVASSIQIIRDLEQELYPKDVDLLYIIVEIISFWIEIIQIDSNQGKDRKSLLSH